MVESFFDAIALGQVAFEAGKLPIEHHARKGNDGHAEAQIKGKKVDARFTHCGG